MMTPTSNRRLQLATRIHYALMRELGQGIDVGRLLKQPLYARDVLQVVAGAGVAHQQHVARIQRLFQQATDVDAPAELAHQRIVDAGGELQPTVGSGSHHRLACGWELSSPASSTQSRDRGTRRPLVQEVLGRRARSSAPL